MVSMSELIHLVYLPIEIPGATGIWPPFLRHTIFNLDVHELLDLVKVLAADERVVASREVDEAVVAGAFHAMRHSNKAVVAGGLALEVDDDLLRGHRARDVVQ